jgi:tripeptidyl-peptidase-1
MRLLHSCLRVAAFLLLFRNTIATPLINNHVQHEKRVVNSDNPWRVNQRVPGNAIIPLRIGLVQSNLDQGSAHLESISHPGSPRYGQHLSMDEVHSLFAPAESTVEAVRSWLLDSGIGIKSEDIVHSDNRGWLALDVTASSVEHLFKTSM